MKVRINQAIASSHWSYRKGQTVEMGEDQAQAWIEGGLASPVAAREEHLAGTPAEEAVPRAKTAKKQGRKK